jgi:hypothetical protein
MIEQWEWYATKKRLSRASQRLTDIITKISLEDIPSDSPLYKARQEYDEALREVAAMQSQMHKEKQERKRLKRLIR